MSLHFNKGLAGATEAAIAAARSTAMNPPWRSRSRGAGARRYDRPTRRGARVGAYLNECDYFQENWQRAFWGSNYPRLADIKRRYDPDGLFTVHHSVGSEAWSADGFTRAP